MADVFLQLSAEDRRDALGVAADRSAVPPIFSKRMCG
jgi:hypothetical protein